jgi:hypothetical protein
VDCQQVLQWVWVELPLSREVRELVFLPAALVYLAFLAEQALVGAPYRNCCKISIQLESVCRIADRRW